MCVILFFFFFKQKAAYEVRISDWSSDVCSSDLALEEEAADEIALGNDGVQRAGNIGARMVGGDEARLDMLVEAAALVGAVAFGHADQADAVAQRFGLANVGGDQAANAVGGHRADVEPRPEAERGEEIGRAHV